MSVDWSGSRMAGPVATAAGLRGPVNERERNLSFGARRQVFQKSAKGAAKALNRVAIPQCGAILPQALHRVARVEDLQPELVLSFLLPQSVSRKLKFAFRMPSVIVQRVQDGADSLARRQTTKVEANLPEWLHTVAVAQTQHIQRPIQTEFASSSS